MEIERAGKKGRVCEGIGKRRREAAVERDPSEWLRRRERVKVRRIFFFVGV